MRQKSWNSISAWLRVLTKISVVLLRLISSYISPSACRAVCPAQGNRSWVSSISTTGAAGHDDVGGQFAAVALRHQEPRQRFRLGHRRGKTDRAHFGGQPPQPRQP